MFEMVEGILSQLWTDTATVKVVQDTIANGAKIPGRSVLYENIPCRISYQSVVSPNKETGTRDLAIQVPFLICSPSYDIPAGSLIAVTRNGRTVNYQQSGQLKRYDSHIEVPMALDDDEP